MDLKFEFSFKTKINNSFRVKSLIGQYDLENKENIQHFKGDYKLPEKWNIGLIIGNSGTGKTSIAKHCFGEFTKCCFDENPIIENFNKDLKMDYITEILGSVGFNSVPYWLKPFFVLSNGEKSRVELAKMITENHLIIYDEFTSLVDRDVAKSMSNSIKKTIKKYDKQFIAVTCHKDITEWIEPDWIYDTDEHVFFCIKNNETKNLNLKLKEQQIKHGHFIKNIII